WGEAGAARTVGDSTELCGVHGGLGVWGCARRVVVGCRRGAGRQDRRMRRASMEALREGHVSAPGVSLSEVPFQELIREVLRRLGEDVGREGLRKTPERVERSLAWLTRGYRLSVAQVIGDAIFEEDHHNMVVVKDI